jgi:hypothetical protein
MNNKKYDPNLYIQKLKDEFRYIEFKFFEVTYLFENDLVGYILQHEDYVRPSNLKENFEKLTAINKRNLCTEINRNFKYTLIDNQFFVGRCYFYFLHTLNKDKDFFKSDSFGDDEFLSFFKIECILNLSQDRANSLGFIRRSTTITHPRIPGKRTFEKFIEEARITDSTDYFY